MTVLIWTAAVLSCVGLAVGVSGLAQLVRHRPDQPLTAEQTGRINRRRLLPGSVCVGLAGVLSWVAFALQR